MDLPCTNMATVLHFSVRHNYFSDNNCVDDQTGQKLEHKVEMIQDSQYDLSWTRQKCGRAHKRREHKQADLEHAHLFLVKPKVVGKRNNQDSVKSKKEGTEHRVGNQEIEAIL